MRNILIGSRALDYWNIGFKCSTEADWDVISDEPIEGTEWHDPEFLNNKYFEYYTDDINVIEFNGDELHVVNLEGLAIIKRSHLWRDLGFSKHVTMHHKHLARYLDTTKQVNRDTLSVRKLLTIREFPQQGPNLKKTVEDFFDDAVVKKYSHDWLHELYAFEDKPMYTKMQTNPELAWCDKQLWDGFTHEQKLQCVVEEVMVIATERFLVPKNWSYPYKQVYLKSLQKVCTTLTSGWFREFSIDYYPELVEMFNQSIFDEVKNKLRE